MSGRHSEGTIYGNGLDLTPDQQALYERVIRSARGLRDQLRELVQLSHRSARPADVAAVQAALFRAHGYQGGR